MKSVFDIDNRAGRAQTIPKLLVGRSKGRDRPPPYGDGEPPRHARGDGLKLFPDLRETAADRGERPPGPGAVRPSPAIFKRDSRSLAGAAKTTFGRGSARDLTDAGVGNRRPALGHVHHQTGKRRADHTTVMRKCLDRDRHFTLNAEPFQHDALSTAACRESAPRRPE